MTDLGVAALLAAAAVALLGLVGLCEAVRR
jgi:hypothetical protein